MVAIVAVDLRLARRFENIPGQFHAFCRTDNENSTLKRFHPSAQFIDISESRELDDIFGAFGKVEVVIVDCRAASTDLFTLAEIKEILALKE